uniref:Uncharacterized protein MANES_01G177500 n=1 Tax=Rhizophora mucronata TaxID=61149 RepID=A0A2P2IK36_RHIMU
MATISLRKGNTRLPPEVNRVLYVRNLPFNITSEEMYDIFGKYGAIRQIRIGTNKDIYDGKTGGGPPARLQRREQVLDCSVLISRRR